MTRKSTDGCEMLNRLSLKNRFVKFVENVNMITIDIICGVNRNSSVV
jgi:hypothetical protein